MPKVPKTAKPPAIRVYEDQGGRAAYQIGHPQRIARPSLASMAGAAPFRRYEDAGSGVAASFQGNPQRIVRPSLRSMGR